MQTLLEVCLACLPKRKLPDENYKHKVYARSIDLMPSEINP